MMRPADVAEVLERDQLAGTGLGGARSDRGIISLFDATVAIDLSGAIQW